jgi:hypothetical protein
MTRRHLTLEPSGIEFDRGRKTYRELVYDLERLGFETELKRAPLALRTGGDGGPELVVRLKEPAGAYILERLATPILVRVGPLLSRRGGRRRAAFCTQDGHLLAEMTLSEAHGERKLRHARQAKNPYL